MKVIPEIAGIRVFDYSKPMFDDNNNIINYEHRAYLRDGSMTY